VRAAASIAVLLAVVGAALVGVREKSEICRLQYRVFELERKRDGLERQVRELVAGVADALSPRGLLEEADRRAAATGAPAPVRTEGSPEGAQALHEDEP
jgi:hypothetical protein